MESSWSIGLAQRTLSLLTDQVMVIIGCALVAAVAANLMVWATRPRLTRRGLAWQRSSLRALAMIYGGIVFVGLTLLALQADLRVHLLVGILIGPVVGAWSIFSYDVLWSRLLGPWIARKLGND